MNIFEADRDVLPIWVDSQEAAKLPELGSIARNKINVGEFINSTPIILSEFESSKSIGVAIELLNSAIIESEHEIAVQAAEYLHKAEGLPNSIRDLALRTLGLEPQPYTEQAVNTITKLRARIKSGRSDPLAWVDLSREYAILGEKERSQKAMLVALQLSGGHRFITRVAARAFVHFKEPDIAYGIISRNANVRTDPWLVATEMAVARKADRPTKLWNIGKRLLESNIQPIHISELASSVATNELVSGAEKKAKPFFKQSLIAPNQNSLAQAKWAERTSGLKKLVQVPMDKTVIAYEAQYWEAYSNKDMEISLCFAKAWFNEEPYSSNPPMAITYLAALLDDYQLILEVAERGLKANPSNVTLKLNNIFAWLATKDLNALTEHEQAQTEAYVRDLKAIINGDDWSEAAHAQANIGMLLYRLGKPEDGRQIYELADELFEKNAPSARVMLVVNHLREALIAEAPWAVDILKSAHELLTRRNSSATPGAAFYLEKISLLSTQPGTWKERFDSVRSATSINEDLSSKNRKPIEVGPRIDIKTKFWLPIEFGRIETLKDFTSWKQPEGSVKKR